jgi:hypothetical protein
MLNIIIYLDHGLRSKRICYAMIEGITRCGDKCNVRFAQDYNGEIEGDIAIFYGLRERLKTIFETYKKAGKKAILIDLGYWHRDKGGKLEGYHKIVINDYHPTKYFQSIKHDNIRSSKLNLELKQFNKSGEHILIAGMSAKSAWANDLKTLEYENWTIEELSKITKRPLSYRPKPSWKGSGPLNGTNLYFDQNFCIEKCFENCWAVVTHHSNVSVDALLNGIPVFLKTDAPASVLGRKDLNEIENPYYPSEAELTQWLNDMSYTQWRPCEMENGETWEYLKSSNLLYREDI